MDRNQVFSWIAVSAFGLEGAISGELKRLVSDPVHIYRDLAKLANTIRPEYVIPVNDEAQALPLLRSLLGEMSASARAQLFLSAGSGAAAGVSKSVQAPVNISVTSTSAQAEAVGRSVYDTAQRSLLKTLQGVFSP